MRFRVILRLLRIVVMFRKMNEMRKISLKFNKSRALSNVEAPVEKVLEFIEEIQEAKWIKKNKDLKFQVRWLQETIQNNKIYDNFVNQNTSNLEFMK